MTTHRAPDFVSPDSFTGFAGQPEAFPKTWPRHWGADTPRSVVS